MKARKRKLGRTKSQRKALLKALATALILNGRIKTTEAKAKAVKPEFEKLVTKAKKGDMHMRRIVGGFLNKDVTKRLFNEIAPKYASRHGGYTRIIKLGPRKSDGARMAYIEIV